MRISPTILLLLPVSVVMTALAMPARADHFQAQEVSMLIPADGAAEDAFGRAVAIDGSTAVVGAPFDDDRGLNSGSVYLFQRDQGGLNGWGQAGKLTVPDGNVGDEFGIAVSVSGDHLVVGAQRSNIAGTNRGAAYVYRRAQPGAGPWTQAAALTASDANFQDLFGAAVAVSGDWIVVGAKEDDDRGAQSGSAYVFGRNAGGTDNWGQVAKLTASDGAANDLFGGAVAIFGDFIVVGAEAGDGLVANSGAAYVFARNAGGTNNWGQVAKLTANDGALNDSFGISVAIHGDRVLVGANKDDAPLADSGSAYIFERNAGGAGHWGQVAKLVAQDPAVGDQFGISVSLWEDRALVGAHFEDDAGQESGAAYVFWRHENGAGAWGQVAKIGAGDGAADDRFGFSLSLTDDLALIGAFKNDPRGMDSGSAYVFGLSGAGSVKLYRSGFEAP
jgi:hypothetical protein